MSLDQFVTKWLGKRTDYDHVYQYQCVDLILQYLAEVHGITSGVWGNAIDYWLKPTARLLQDFDKVTGTPQAGDIVVLNGTNGNPYGHIMVAVNSTTAIEQNGYSGDGDGLNGDEIRYRTIPTARVAGLLRKKGSTDEMITKDDVGLLRIGHSEIGNWDSAKTHAGEYDDLFLGAWQGKSVKDFVWAQWNNGNPHRVNQYVVDGLNSQIDVLNKRPTQDTLDKEKARADEAASKLGTVTQQNTDLTKQVETLKAQVGDNSKWETLKALVRELVGK